jgi:hypothetical protein
MKKTVAILLLMTVLSACYGPFRLTKKVYQWNNTNFDTKWEKETVFIALTVLPVYGFAAFADTVFFNAVEFWDKPESISYRSLSIEGPKEHCIAQK